METTWKTLTVGRDPACDLVVADGSISRRHAELLVFADGRLFVRDLGSQNGTGFVHDGERCPLTAQFIDAGDAIVFGDVELPYETLGEMIATAGAPLPAADAPRAVAGRIDPPPAALQPVQQSGADGAAQPRFREFLPAVTGFDRLWQRGLLVPMAAFAALVALLFSTRDPLRFINIMGVGITLGSYTLVYRSCGKRKPWLVVGLVIAAEAGLMLYLTRPYALLFRTLTGAGAWTSSKSFPEALVGHFIAAGMMEELMKMTPVFVLIALTRRLAAGRSPRWGVSEPLDAIVYACAAAAGFVMIETLLEYAPGEFRDVAKAINLKTHDADLALAVGYLEATRLALARTLDSASGHLAFSGYFGYYVGLGLMRPSQVKRYWIGGYIGAAALHGFGNALGVFESVAATTVMNFVAVTFLVAAILNGRKVSPTRDENFATRAYPTLSRTSTA